MDIYLNHILVNKDYHPFMIKSCNFLRHQPLDSHESELRLAEDVKLSACWEATQPYLYFCIYFLPLSLLLYLLFAFLFSFEFVFCFYFFFCFYVLIGSISAKKRENNKRKNFIQEYL